MRARTAEAVVLGRAKGEIRRNEGPVSSRAEDRNDVGGKRGGM